MMHIKKIAAMAVAFAALAGTVLQPLNAFAATKTYVALGADLDANQRATVLQLLHLTEADLAGDTVVTVTNAEEHEYLDSYISPSVIGTNALSSCKVVEEAKGHGITVETYNITYCTPSMYQNALATAGMKNASVTVAGPMNISGTAALVGAMKAYAKMYGNVIQPQYIEGATNELVTTGKLAEEIGDPEKAAELIAAVKEIIVVQNITNEGDIYVTINNVSNEMGINLTDEQVEQIVGLMKQLAALDLDADTLVDQAKGIYDNLKSSGIDLSQYGVTDEDVSGFWDFLKELIERILSIFRQ
ncbi:MAG: DUF1002 domain-containing protein [Lachnospiraceae bacterium]|nr:DUF1002 domain-containing protein [Lachnospiraceae bacterium]